MTWWRVEKCLNETLSNWAQESRCLGFVFRLNRVTPPHVRRIVRSARSPLLLRSCDEVRVQVSSHVDPLWMWAFVHHKGKAFLLLQRWCHRWMMVLDAGMRADWIQVKGPTCVRRVECTFNTGGPSLANIWAMIEPKEIGTVALALTWHWPSSAHCPASLDGWCQSRWGRRPSRDKPTAARCRSRPNLDQNAHTQLWAKWSICN